VRTCGVVLVAAIVSAPLGAQFLECAEPGLPPELVAIYEGCPLPPERLPEADDDYAAFERQHRLMGTASYYAQKFEGRKTANGERFSNALFTAAHRTLPLGTWVEVTSLATGRTIRVKVNDRGPFKGGFVLDLSRRAARALGVDVAADRRVKVRVIALPGETVEQRVEPSVRTAAVGDR
jgi:rare lipoprotein A